MTDKKIIKEHRTLDENDLNDINNTFNLIQKTLERLEKSTGDAFDRLEKSTGDAFDRLEKSTRDAFDRCEKSIDKSMRTFYITFVLVMALFVGILVTTKIFIG